MHFLFTNLRSKVRTHFDAFNLIAVANTCAQESFLDHLPVELEIVWQKWSEVPKSRICYTMPRSPILRYHRWHRFRLRDVNRDSSSFGAHEAGIFDLLFALNLKHLTTPRLIRPNITVKRISRNISISISVSYLYLHPRLS